MAEVVVPFMLFSLSLWDVIVEHVDHFLHAAEEADAYDERTLHTDDPAHACRWKIQALQ